MWFGTQSGLSCFNGYEFNNYFTDPIRPVSLSNNWIYDITEDPDGFIYLGTKGGLNKFDKKTGEFTVVQFRDTLSAGTRNFIYGLAAENHLLYINTPPYLTIFNTRSGESDLFQNSYSGQGTVYDIGFPILAGQGGKIWIASYNGLSVFDTITKKFRNLSLDDNNGAIGESQYITVLREENDGNILAGTINGLYLINPETYEGTRLSYLEQRLSSNYIRDIARDNNGMLWIATEGGGLNRLSTDRDYLPKEVVHYRSNQNFVSHDIIYKLFIDRSENLWVGTIAGLDKSDLKKSGIRIIANTGDPGSYNLLDNVIASVYMDPSGRLWIGNWGKGLNILNEYRDQEEVLHYTSSSGGKFHIPENHVHLIFEDSRGRIFIGTRNGVSVYNRQQGSFVPVHDYFSNPDFDCFSDIRVYCMMEDRERKLWIGTGYGITILDLPSNEIRTLRAENPPGSRINSNLVYSILEDRDGIVWIAGSEGINLYYPEKDTILSMRRSEGNTNTLCNNFTVSLCEDVLGHIWIGTGSGLNRFSKADSSFLYFSRSVGLPSEIFYNIIEDNQHQLWFTTGKGLAVLDPTEAEEGKFRVIDPLKGREFNLKAVHRSKDGEMFFGSMNGLYSFYPDSLTRNNFIPPVRFTSIQKEKDGKIESLNPWQKNVHLSYRDYAFTIEFAALDFTSPEKNRYTYKMEGLSDNWYNLGERRFVHFTNLPSGTYTFMVKGTNSDGLWNDQPVSLNIVISPPWWASNYAFIAYGIALVFIIILIIWFRERNLKEEKRRLEEEVKKRTHELALQKQNAEESEQKLRSTVQSLDDIMFVLDEKGNLQEFYNPRKRKTHFIFPELHIGKHYSTIRFPEEIIAEFKKAYETPEEDHRVVEFDHHFMDEGIIYWYNTKISPKMNAQGRLTGLVIVARDITDRKNAEELLARQKEELNELNTAKDKFFSILAHDLKNPFTNLHSLGDILVRNYPLLDEEDKLEAIKKIHQASGFIYELL
ncbi:MAG: PAS domain S-box protein, partial [Bacteroidales bacterium]|nr:PAS domain S-box protein [Bacteroidales bacterium]